MIAMVHKIGFGCLIIWGAKGQRISAQALYTVFIVFSMKRLESAPKVVFGLGRFLTRIFLLAFVTYCGIFN